MYFVEEGSVSIRIEQENGEVEISVLGKGQYFGELALVTHRPRAASAYAASDNVKVACEYIAYTPIILNMYSLYLYIFYIKHAECALCNFVYDCLEAKSSCMLLA